MSETIAAASDPVPLPPATPPAPGTPSPTPVAQPHQPGAPLQPGMPGVPTAPGNPAPPPGQPAQPAAPPRVELPFDQVQSLLAARDRLATIEELNRQKERELEEQKARQLAKQGEWEKGFQKMQEDKEKELQAIRGEKASVEERAKRYALEGELSREMAMYPLVNPTAAAMLMQTFRPSFEVHPQGDSFAVRTPTFQSVREFLAAEMAKPDYAPFLRSSVPGGGTQGGPTSPAVSPVAPPPEAPAEPANLGDAIVLAAKAGAPWAQQGRHGSAADAAKDLSRSFGLRPVKAG